MRSLRKLSQLRLTCVTSSKSESAMRLYSLSQESAISLKVLSFALSLLRMLLKFFIRSAILLNQFGYLLSGCNSYFWFIFFLLCLRSFFTVWFTLSNEVIAESFEFYLALGVARPDWRPVLSAWRFRDESSVYNFYSIYLRLLVRDYYLLGELVLMTLLRLASLRMEGRLEILVSSRWVLVGKCNTLDYTLFISFTCYWPIKI